jgi:fumarylacetoacetase
MTRSLDRTHDAGARSWVETANDPRTDFPIQNLPFGVFRRRGRAEAPRIGVAIGDQILDVARLAAEGGMEGFDESVKQALAAPSLNPLMTLGRSAATALRDRFFGLLEAGCPEPGRPTDCMVESISAELLLPAEIGDYTDFYASIHHATNVGSMFRPENPLLPNYKFVPIGYHGRASSIVVSGTPVRRPMGQTKDDQATAPVFGPSRSLDYECEVGCYLAEGNALGSPITLAEAERYLFGLSLLNDWSARDIQRWEYQPLGPFLAKNFASTVSPWVVTFDALAPFRLSAFDRPAGDPHPLPYLNDERDRRTGGIGLTVEVLLRTERMRTEGIAAARLSAGNLASMYWTMGQLVTHHASNGCNLRPADLIGSGTVSGPERENRGCLLELTWRGSEPISLPTGEVRRFLQDGDEVIMTGRCERDGFVAIGLGECRGTVVAA